MRWIGVTHRARGPRRDAIGTSFAGMFARFALTGLVAMVLIGAVDLVLVRRAAGDSAIRQATELSQLAGTGIVAPLLSPQVLYLIQLPLAYSLARRLRR